MVYPCKLSPLRPPYPLTSSKSRRKFQARWQPRRIMTGPLAEKSSLGVTGDLSVIRVRGYAARYLGVAPEQVFIAGLTPDASTRKYYRIAASRNPQETLIISLYPAPFNPHDNTFIDVTRLFA